MSAEKKPDFDASAYWNRRYQTVDATRSGHIDLPEAYNAWLYRRKRSHFASAVQKLGDSLSGARLLEVAAGSGAWMEFWRQMDVADYFGIDLSERAIAVLKDRFPESRFAQYDLNNADMVKVVGDGYDCVTAIDVLYHILDDEKFASAITEFGRVLRPGGLLVLHDVFTPTNAINHVQHIRWRSLAQYEEALAQAGLEVVYRRPTFLFMVQNSHFRGLWGKILDFTWRFLTYPLIARLPKQAGALAYFVDSGVCGLLHRGPSMELMICCKKRIGPSP